MNRKLTRIQRLEQRVLLSGNMLVFSAEPIATSAGSVINSPTGVQVTIENSNGQKVAAATDSITLSFAANPGGGFLGGTLTNLAVGGIATFSNLTIGNAANGYSLLAIDGSAGNVTQARSTLFNVNPVPLFKSLSSFTDGQGGQSPDGSLIQDSSGNLYGTTSGGGLFGDGVVFELSGTNHATYTTLFSFTGTSGTSPGQNPVGDLCVGSNGNIYGVTSSGGALNDGTVFELSGSNHATFTSLVSFTGTSGNAPGSDPVAGLALDASGNLYGTCSSSPASNGEVFELSGANLSVFTTLVQFTGTAGSFPGKTPSGQLLIDSSGNLFGTTAIGGSAGNGTVFELSGSAHSTFISLVSFTNTSGPYLGRGPLGGLVHDSSGNLYGTTQAGGTSGYGTAFMLSGTNHTVFTSLASFTYQSTGSSPTGNLAIDTAGNLYGSTQAGGAGSYGAVFELSGSTHMSLATLAVFGVLTAGETPTGMYIDSSGNLFGVLGGGGTYNFGAVYEIAASNRNSAPAIYSFTDGNAINPSNSLVVDSAGNLFGATTAGGLYGYGSIYEWSGTNHSVYTTLVSFTYHTGAYLGQDPQSGLIIDSSGDIFGTTLGGGLYNNGTIFELVGPAHTTFKSLYSFGNGVGTGSISTLVLDSSGNLYGTTEYGGASGYGDVYGLSGANYGTFTDLISFTGYAGAAPGYLPLSGMTIDSAGDLYGTTYDGGTSGDGSVFEISGPTHATYTVLANFTGSSGAYPGRFPTTTPILDGAGNLLGTTGLAPYEPGTVYELSGPGHNIFTSLASFSTNVGLYPSKLVLDTKGSLFGATQNYGAHGGGTVFELSGAGYSVFSTLVSFTGSSGNNSGVSPESGLTLDNQGNLFGTTNSGGDYGFGTLYEISDFGSPSVDATSGAVTINPPLGDAGYAYFSSISVESGASITVTPSSASASLIVTSSLILPGATNAWTGTIDLANNALDIIGGSLAAVTNQIDQGYKNGTWMGSGITSSFAASNSTHLVGLGTIQNNQSGSALFTSTNLFEGSRPGLSDILIKYTYYGDANLDGKVDGSDYSLIDNGFLKHLTGWFNGDFNYDGVVDGSDYALIDNAFNQQGASVAAQVAEVAAAIFKGEKASKTKRAALFSQVSLPGPVAATCTAQTVISSVADEIFASNSIDLLAKTTFAAGVSSYID